ncbi:MFS transporter [Chamaesiphon sp.]|uniref:MFS transporter n=1 Tax=Chamaesiphon sp. TaxID=2814140 RepID=UPI003593B23C
MPSCGIAPDRCEVPPVNFESVEAIASTNLAELASITSNTGELNQLAPTELVKSKSLQLVASKAEIRTSLEASTIDGVFAAVFLNITSGVLLTNFLLELGANSTEIGLLASIPMLANLMQPIGAYFAEQTTSRHSYCLWIYGISRSLWVGLAVAIFQIGQSNDSPLLVLVTLGIATASCFLGALGSAAWLSWMAALVPDRLRGRYFGRRNSAANLTNLISVPLMGFAISQWKGGSVQGYSLVLMLGIISGLVSLWFQNFIVDINPLTGSQCSMAIVGESVPQILPIDCWQDPNFLKFLLYFTLWTFAVNLSAPFFNVYLLNELNLDLTQVALYNSLSAGANLLLLMFWGRLADRIGNRPILIGVGIMFALFPLLWLVTGDNSLSIWFWLPLLHLIAGATSAAIDLCSNNLQIDIAPHPHQATYFGIAAAGAGVSGGLVLRLEVFGLNLVMVACWGYLLCLGCCGWWRCCR